MYILTVVKMYFVLKGLKKPAFAGMGRKRVEQTGCSARKLIPVWMDTGERTGRPARRLPRFAFNDDGGGSPP
jgi:hypothetical protein